MISQLLTLRQKKKVLVVVKIGPCPWKYKVKRFHVNFNVLNYWH